jgi:hypothetical protein
MNAHTPSAQNEKEIEGDNDEKEEIKQEKNKQKTR